LAAQIEQGYGQLPIALVVNLVIGLILTVILWGAVDKATLVAWWALLAAVTAVRYTMLSAFRNASRGPRAELNRWRSYFLIGACAAGIVWGLGGVFLFHPSSFSYQVFLAFVLGGMVAGALPLLSSVEHAYACFAIPAVLPASLQMLAVGDRVHLTMGLMMLIFGIAMLASSAQVQRLFRESHDLRRQLTSSLEAGEALQQLLRLDELTGIANRRLFEEALAKEWRRAQRDGDTLAVITADIDYFKEYNDRYGHVAGDRCLIEVAQSMQRALYRPGDVAARIGGEEFAFLLPGTTLHGARSVAELIRRRILSLELPHASSMVADRVTVSLGVASSDQDSISSAEDLLCASDAALYEAKRQGRNQVVVQA
jgi:diguanylate cyclase (GGDEF)-like protein